MTSVETRDYESLDYTVTYRGMTFNQHQWLLFCTLGWLPEEDSHAE